MRSDAARHPMAIVRNPLWRRPRRAIEPNRRKSAENPAVDIGWADGLLSDGRPFRAECWAENGVTSLTFFMDVAGIEDADVAFFHDLLSREELVRFRDGPTYVAVGRTEDSAGFSMWSVNVVVGDEDCIYCDSRVPLSPYGGSGEVGAGAATASGRDTVHTNSWLETVLANAARVRETRFAAARSAGARWLVECRDLWDFDKRDCDGGLFFLTCANDDEAVREIVEHLDDSRKVAVDEVFDLSRPEFTRGISARDWLLKQCPEWPGLAEVSKTVFDDFYLRLWIVMGHRRAATDRAFCLAMLAASGEPATVVEHYKGRLAGGERFETDPLPMARDMDARLTRLPSLVSLLTGEPSPPDSIAAT